MTINLITMNEEQTSVYVRIEKHGQVTKQFLNFLRK